MHDYLLENSIMYKDLVQEGEMKGEERNARRNIEAVVRARFPNLVTFVQECIKDMHNPQELQTLLVAMSVATTELDAPRYLLALNESE